MLYNQRAIMAEIHANRRARLRQLLEERFEGNQALMSRAGGYAAGATYLCELLNANHTMGFRAARKIEVALGLPEGWMDCQPPPGVVPKTPYQARLNQPLLKAHTVHKLLSAGYTQREAARQLGVHESTVSRAIKKEGKSGGARRVAA